MITVETTESAPAEVYDVKVRMKEKKNGNAISAIFAKGGRSPIFTIGMTYPAYADMVDAIKTAHDHKKDSEVDAIFKPFSDAFRDLANRMKAGK